VNTSNQSKHEFAFYIEDISSICKSLSQGDELHIDNKQLFHRIENIVRLKPGESYTLFDRLEHIKLCLTGTKKKRDVIGSILQKEKNERLKPNITFILPLLKREHFEHALYSLVELGAQTIQPIMVQKSQKKWDTQRTYARYINIMITAAEQSKTFAFAHLNHPIKLEALCAKLHAEEKKIFFDPNGQNLYQTIEKIKSSSYDKIVLMIGPEGDLLEDEKKFLRDNNFIFCKLTPTILRSFQAATVGLGAFRSLL